MPIIYSKPTNNDYLPLQFLTLILHLGPTFNKISFCSSKHYIEEGLYIFPVLR